ncbi:MAG TPA: helix-turn-helix transcriptional regulator [Candidatus Pullichristensenella avicola]|nr:helix-turn-helix transcriptional regulator [Candidatus Pullichristensenella avicola]
MEEINALFSMNLKRLRAARRMSLDEVSRLSGVSKSMLGQIERGEVNPTISTVWKIAGGLKVPYSELLSRPQASCEVVRTADVSPVLEDGGRYRNYMLFPLEEGRRFEVVYIEIDAGGALQAAAHPRGTQEFVAVFSGRLRVRVGEAEYVAADGEALRFAADRPHRYENVGGDLCRMSMIIHYPS